MGVSGAALQRGLVVLAAVVLSWPVASVRADVLLEESFAGASASVPLRVGGSFTPCLTASTDTGQENVPGCAAGQPSIPPGGDLPGAGALRLTDNAHDRSGSAIYRHAFPFTQGVRFTFTTFAYNGVRVPGYGAADGISVFLADGAVAAQRPGAFGGSLGYAQKSVDFDATVPDIGGVPGGYLGVGIDEFGNFANDREARGYGCARRVDRDLHPNFVSLRGRGVPGDDWMRGYCLLDRAPAPPPGVLDQPDAIVRTAPGVAHTFRIEIDPLGNPDGTPSTSARVRVFADMANGGAFVPVLDAPLPPDPPATFEFGLAASTGQGTNVHEIRAVRLETIAQLPRWTLAKTHAAPLVAGTDGSFTLQAALAADGGAAYAPVVLEDELPDGLTLTALPHGEGWDCAGTTVGGAAVRCRFAASLTEPLTAGTRLAPLTVPVRVAPDAVGARVNVARLSGDEILDPIEAEDPFELRRRVDVEIAKHANPGRIAVGDRTSFTLVVTNHGPSDAARVTVVDRLPDGLALVGALPTQGDCRRIAARLLRCSLGALRARASAQIAIDATAEPAAAGRTLRNVAVVRAEEDQDPRNDRSSADVEVVGPDVPDPPPADDGAVLQVDKQADRDSVRVGEPVRYTIRVHNGGTATAHDVRLVDTSTMSGTTDPVPAVARTCARDEALIRCRLGDVAAGETVTLAAQVVYDRVGLAANGVTVTPATGPLAGRADVARVRVRGGSGLRIRKRADRRRLRIGETVRYRITVRATGTRAARRVRVCDRLPGQLRLIAAPGATGRRTVCWTVPALVAGRTRTVMVAAEAARPAAALRNTATARAAGIRRVSAAATVAILGRPRAGACAARVPPAYQAC